MSEDFGWIEDNDLNELVQRFDKMIQANLHFFFDVNEFEAIIDYFIDFQEFDKARVAIDSAIQQHPRTSTFIIRNAKLNALNGEYYEALEELNQIGLMEPASDELYVSKAEIYSMMSKHELSIEQYEKAIPLSANPEDIYSVIAFEYENLNDYPNAIKNLKNALGLKPESENIIHEIAFFFDITNREEDAIDFFKDFLDSNPYSKVGWFNLGIFYNQLELYEKAIEAYEFTIAIDDEYSSAYFNIANSLSGLDRYEEAIGYYKETFNYEVPEPITHYYIGESYEHLNDIKNAMHHFNKALELNENLADAWAGLGRLFIAQDNDPKAIVYYTKAVDLMPNNTEFRFDLAMIHLKDANYGTAGNLFSEISKQDTFNVEAWINYSACVFAVDDTDNAIEIIEEAINTNKESALLWYRLAGYLHVSGKVQQAYFYIETALKLNHEQHTELLDLIPDLYQDSRFIELLGVYKDSE